MRAVCKEKFVSKVSSKKGFAIFTFENEKFNVDVNELLKQYRNRIRFSPGLLLCHHYVTLVLQHNDDIKVLKEIKEFLRNI